MSLENDFLVFAGSNGANVVAQSAYVGSAWQTGGFSAGLAQSQQLNKPWRQSSIMSAVLAQFIVNNSGQPAIDDGTTSTLLTNLQTAVSAAARAQVILADTGTANAYAAANPAPLTALPTTSGVVQKFLVGNSNTANSTYAPDGLVAKPIFGLGGQQLQGGELPANGIATLVSYVGPLLNSGALCWVLFECIGGAQQIAAPTQTNHAVNLGQFLSVLSASGYFEIPVVVAGVKRTAIVQWGQATSNSSGIATLSLPTPFPNSLLVAVANYVNNGTTVVQASASISNSSTTSSLVAVAQSAGTPLNSAQVNFVAVGF